MPQKAILNRRTSEQIKTEIIDRLGFFPPFFEPALRSPNVLENLWQQTLSGYIENPIPELFKEKLAAVLARYCTVPYCLLCHSSALRPLGMTASAVLEILEQPPLSSIELAEKTKCLDAERIADWPEANSHLEECILYCAVAIFLGEDTVECQQKLRNLLPDSYFDNLISFIAYNRTSLTWAEAHPELDFKNDKRVRENYAPLVADEPRLADFFSNYQGRAKAQMGRRAKWLTEENKAFVKQERVLRADVESEQARLIRVFEAMPNPVAMLNGPDHRFTFTNSSYRDLLIGGKKVVGRTVADALPEAIEQGFGKLLDNVYQTGIRIAASETPIDLEQADGQMKKFYLDILYEAVRDADGEIEGIVVVVTDVTQQVVQRQLLVEVNKAVSIQQRKLDLIIKEAPIGIALFTGADLKFEIANEQWQALVPNQRTYIGRTYDEVYPDLIPTGLSKIIRKVFDSGETFTALEMLVPVMKADGSMEERYFDLSYIRMTDADEVPYGVFSVAANITDRVMAKIELSEAKADAERANLLKSAFLANMSHEIRTPLGAMIGFADLMRDPGLSEGERSNYINILLRNGDQLSVIINDILDLSKVEAGHLTLEYIDTDHKIIGLEVVSLMQGKAREKDLSLEYSADMTTPSLITSDPTRVRQILLNLVGNAIKFTQFGSVKIRAYGGKTDSGKRALCFEVSDTGIGISAPQIKRLFQTFSQADETTTRRFGGTGLGLALSRRLARALGGDITIAQSAEGVGTTFLVKIADEPDKRSSIADTFKVERRNEPDVKEQSLVGLKILVVDDAPDNRALIWHYLTKQGASVESAENGLLGFKTAIAGDFDLVLMDIQMPVMDGYSATQKLREAGYRKPIVALTAHAMNEIRKKALNVGYTDHLTKPINPADLIRTILRLTAAPV